MLPAQVDFTIQQGSNWSRTITLRNEDGTLFDLTGYAVRMQAREELSDTVTVISSTATVPNITIAISIPLGTVTLSMTAAQTAALLFNSARYDIEFVIGTVVYRFFQGTIVLSKEVTR